MTLQTKSPVHEPLPEAIARHRRSFGDGVFALIVMPDGSGFHCVPNGEAMDAERLTRDEMAAALVEKIYGLAAFRGN
ncbi:hypothetical protein GOL96_24930 [Sinorhizobium medicae]|uniref:Uncharacterized protein n=1 Tax=Sinorhizobium medicae TaxID=110321 RepID=A0ABX4TT22_9HYPH|nr:hypothetical protein [Sinorhizobium medicae]MDX0695060.1 hypothetical protein [Sinorhizobium medicae]MDX0744845.1 hypothetical protein [Sinorhizobium medicae]MDX0801717.1 hypothetical protein [Sinorhizobium medicae]MDX1194620.1 hypothetical protein [Sinorhizobium medicae]